MTTLDELCQVIDSIGLPWANTDFERGDDVSPPYIVLKKTGGSVNGANDSAWCHLVEYDVELYTTRRDYALERTVTDALEGSGIFFDDGGFWGIPEQGMVEAVFTVTVREN